MAVISVPRELRERLGDPATDSLVDLLHQFGDEQRDDLIAVVEERFARHVAESRDTLRSEMHAGFGALRSEMHTGHDTLRSEMHAGHDALRSEMHTGHDALRSEMHTGLLDVQKQLLDQQRQLTSMAKEIGSVRADLRKEITVQTRWLLTMMVAATILIPVMQRVLGAAFP